MTEYYLAVFATCFLGAYIGTWLANKIVDLLNDRQDKKKITLIPDGNGDYYTFNGNYQIIKGEQK